MIKYIAPLLLAASFSYAQQNLKDNYTPLKSSGTLPDIFTQNIRTVIQKDITELNRKSEENDKSLKRTYLTAANYEIEKIVKSGNTLINDEITQYVNQLASVILKNNTALRNELHIYTLKSPVVNAYSYDKGYIFLDIGLIAQAETEAQLAYILCHEISHYTKKHNVNSYVKNEKIENERYNGKTNEDKLIEKCQYSKENESEADMEGFKMFEQTNYNMKQAEKAFDVLQYSHLPFELVEFKKTFFETENYKLPQGYFLKEVSSIRNNSNEDDTKHTHPNTAKRKQAIADLIATRSNSGRVNTVLGQDKFEYIRDLSRMELCRLYLKGRDYPNALYAAYVLLGKYPNNQYLVEVVSKSLYAMALHGNGKVRYTSDSYLDGGIPSYSEIESYPQQLYHLFQKMPSNEWTMMALNYVYRNHKKFPNNKSITAYSDSLMRMMGQVNWGIVDFVRMNKKAESVVENKTSEQNTSDEPKSKTDVIANIQKENNFKNYDTAYYKEMFVDLFLNDKEFVSKFPTSGTAFETNSGFSDYKSNRNRSSSSEKKVKKSKKSKKGYYVTSDEKVEKVILLEPFYIKFDETQKEEFQQMTSDEKQENLVTTINMCAQKQNFELVTIDPGFFAASEVDKINDYSVINDWFYEKFDADDDNQNPILNTNEIDNIIAKYGTKYVLKTGIVNQKLKGGRKRTLYYAFIYDLKKSEIVYKKYEAFRDKASKDLINAKVYQTFYELKHSR